MMSLRMALGFSVLAAAFTISASAQQATGMDAMRYYVGSWTCKGAPVEEKGFSGTVSDGTATFILQNGTLHERLVIPPKDNQTKTYTLNVTTTYNAAKHRYVSASVDSNENWSVMYAPPFEGGGKLEHWTDHQTSGGDLGRKDVVRYSQNMFAAMSFPSLDRGARPDFRSFCHRVTSKQPAT
jgi:hypothetical protein